ncbi:MAG TPA: hypothetical protein PL105_16630, partial [Caldilineaceae bacterium]|nr:hypothetical protein [Caldilineaceae bacterium]
MKRRQFLIAGSGSLLFGWLSALLPQGAMAAAPAHRYRHTDQEISIFQPESATWQASLRLQSHLRVGIGRGQHKRVAAQVNACAE